jgi:hypothetical protein
MGQGTRAMSVKPSKRYQDDPIPPKQEDKTKEYKGFRKGMKEKLKQALKELGEK